MYTEKISDIFLSNKDQSKSQYRFTILHVNRTVNQVLFIVINHPIGSEEVMRQNKGSKKFWNLICRAAAVLSVSALIFCTPAEAFAETSAAASSDELIEMDSNESTTEESADDTNTDEELITSEEDASTGEMPAEDETGKEELIEDSGTDLISENDDGSTSNTGINKSIEEEIVSDDSAENATNEIGNDSNSEESSELPIKLLLKQDSKGY